MKITCLKCISSLAHHISRHQQLMACQSCPGAAVETPAPQRKNLAPLKITFLMVATSSSPDPVVEVTCPSIFLQSGLSCSGSEGEEKKNMRWRVRLARKSSWQFTRLETLCAWMLLISWPQELGKQNSHGDRVVSNVQVGSTGPLDYQTMKLPGGVPKLIISISQMIQQGQKKRH